MRPVNTKDAKFTAAGYAIYALMYVAILVIMISAIGWQDFWRNLDLTGGTLVLLLFMCALNALLAAAAWKVLRLAPWKQKTLLVISILLAFSYLGDSAWKLWLWYSDQIGPIEVIPLATASSILLACGYCYLAYCVGRLVMTSNIRLEGDGPPAAGRTSSAR